MKQIKLAIATMLFSALQALAQNHEVALVLRHNGLTINGKPALGLVRLQANSQLTLAAGGSASLVFFGDNHREDLKGPCQATVAEAGCTNVPAANRIVSGSRGQLALTRTRGNAQSMAGAALRPAPPAYQVSFDYTSEGIPLLSWSALQGSPQPPFQLKLLPLAGGKAVELSDLKQERLDLRGRIQADQTYAVTITDAAGEQGRSEVRLSDPAVVRSLDSLTQSAQELGLDAQLELAEYLASLSLVDRAVAVVEAAVKGEPETSERSLCDFLLNLYLRQGNLQKWSRLQSKLQD